MAQTNAEPESAVARLNVLWREEYGGVLTESLYRAKYSSDWGAARQLGQCLAEMPQLWGSANPVLVPIPLSNQRLAQRGYNQSVCIARAAASVWGLRVEARGLHKIRQTARQASLPMGPRAENLHLAFRASKKIRQQPVLLIDDIMTTGATLREAARAILAEGGQLVGAAVIAHVNREPTKKESLRVKRCTR